MLLMMVLLRKEKEVLSLDCVQNGDRRLCCTVVFKSILVCEQVPAEEG